MFEILAPFALCAVTALGCGPGPFANRPHTRVPWYALGFANATAGKLRDVSMDWDANGMELHDGAGILVVGARSTSSEAPDPIPLTATISWRTPDGQRHEQEVAVASRVKDTKRFAGTVWFKIADDGVHVVPLTHDEEHQFAVEGKPYP